MIFIIATTIFFALSFFIIYKLANFIGLKISIKSLFLCAICSLLINLILPLNIKLFNHSNLSIVFIIALLSAYFITYYNEKITSSQIDPDEEAFLNTEVLNELLPLKFKTLFSTKKLLTETSLNKDNEPIIIENLSINNNTTLITEEPVIETEVSNELVDEPVIEAEVSNELVDEPVIETEISNELVEEPVIEAEVSNEVVDEPIIETEVSNELIEDPVIETDASSELVEDPIIETEASSELVEESIIETDASNEVVEEPIIETEVSSEVVEEPIIETEASNEVVEDPIIETEASNEVVEEPIIETEVSNELVEEPVIETEISNELVEEPVIETDDIADINENYVLLSDNDVFTTDDMDELVDLATEYKDSSPDKAFKTLQKALFNNQENDYAPFIIIEMTNILKAQGLYAEAIEIYQQALMLNIIKTDSYLLKQFSNTITYLSILKTTLTSYNLPKLPFKEISPEILAIVEKDFAEKNQNL